jgi:acyl carrier protein
VIFKALSTLNEELPEERRLALSASTVLFGVSAEVDSLSLVSLVVDIEAGLAERFGKDIALTDERAMSEAVLPFTSVGTLRDYALMLANEG